MRLISNSRYEGFMEATNSLKTVSQRFSRALFGISKEGKRDLYTVYGYSRENEFDTYFDTYRHQDIANRVVNSVARSCWRDKASIKINDEIVLEGEMRILARAGLFKMMERADILNRIGRFSVLYVGIPDGRDPINAIGTVDSSRLNEVFFTPFAEDGITIHKWNQDVLSPRHGLPEIYNLQVMNRGEKVKDLNVRPIKVHWSRVVHMAEGALDGGLEGIPALQPIMNRLIDLNKTIGGSAEAYFRNARGKYALEAEKGFQSSLGEQAMKDLHNEVEEFTNNWTDAMRLSGVKAKVLTTPHADPVGTVKVALEAISGGTGIPMRVLTGEGAGQLAGNEDKESFNQLIGDRQSLVCTDWMDTLLTILRVAGLIELGEEYDIVWPVASVLNETAQAKLVKDRAEAFEKTIKALAMMSGQDNKVVISKILELELGEFTVKEPEKPTTTLPEEEGAPDAGND